MQCRLSLRVIVSIALFAAVALPRFSPAAEPAREFLNELRNANLYDVAVEYLDRVKDSPLVSPEFKESLAYERGVTLVKGAHFVKDANLREKQLDEAQVVLKDFITNQPRHNLVSAANNELGNLLVQRAGLRIDKAKRPTAGAQKPTLLKEARAMYDDALKIFAAMEAELQTKLKALPPSLDPKKDADKIALRDQLRADYLQTQLLTAAVKEEMADTEAKATKPYNDLLLAAAKDYNEVYEKYRTRLAGMYARLYQGRCYVKMNNHKEALSYFSDLLDQPDQPQEFRTLKIKTLLMAVECWFGGTPKKYDDAIKRIGPFLDTARPDEKKDEEFLALQLWLAKAYKAQADDLASREPGKKVEINKAMGEARKLGTFVSRAQSPSQEEAKKFVAGLRGGDETVDPTKPEPKNFAEAKQAGKEALESMQTAAFNVTELPKQIATEKDAKLKAELEKQLATAKTDVDSLRADALRYYWMALKMADKDTSPEDINVIQYFLCFLHYNMGDLYEAALLGEFVARRYPESSGARQCAKIAMASYLKIYKEVQGDDKSFESGKIVGVASYIVTKWPNEPEAVEAINTLIPFMIKEGKLDEAQGYLAKIPEDAAPRGEAELKIGQSLWSTYLRGMQEVRRKEQDGAAEAELTAEKARLDDIKKRSEKILSDGVARMQKSGDLSPTVATAVLSLGQLYVDTNQAEKAVKLLEDEKIGALTLVQRKDPAIQKEGLPEETLKTALRAYISSLATVKASESDAVVKKAKDMMDALKETAGNTPEGQKKLVSIYVSLARDLQGQMEIAPPEVKKSLSKGFETFLRQVGEGSTEMNILNWVAETFYGIAKSFGSDKAGALSPEAKKYYDEADASFSKMLAKAKQDKTFLSPQMNLQVRHRLAMTKRSLGDFKAAVEMFEEILKESNAMLNVQVEAARTYQEWGSKGADPKARAELYARAMVGAKPDEKKKNENTIWGWGMLAKRTAQDEKFRDTFFEARYNLAVCRYRQAEQFKTSDKEKYEKTMGMAKNDIRLTRQLFPSLGEEEWEPQYNDLLKKVQTALGEKPVGLAEFKKADPAADAGGAPKVVDKPKVEEKPAEAAAPVADKPREPPAAPPYLLMGLGAIVCAVVVAVGLFFATRKGKRPVTTREEPKLAGLEGLDHPKDKANIVFPS